LATARAIGGVNFDGTAAITPTTIVVADTTDTTSFVGLWESATGSLLPKTDLAATYNAGTGVLTAAGLIASGNAMALGDGAAGDPILSFVSGNTEILKKRKIAIFTSQKIPLSIISAAEEYYANLSADSLCFY